MFTQVKRGGYLNKLSQTKTKKSDGNSKKACVSAAVSPLQLTTALLLIIMIIIMINYIDDHYYYYPET